MKAQSGKESRRSTISGVKNGNYGFNMSRKTAVMKNHGPHARVHGDDDEPVIDDNDIGQDVRDFARQLLVTGDSGGQPESARHLQNARNSLNRSSSRNRGRAEPCSIKNFFANIALNDFTPSAPSIDAINDRSTSIALAPSTSFNQQMYQQQSVTLNQKTGTVCD